MSQKYDEYLEKHRQAVKKAYRSIVEEILEMIRMKLAEVENAEN